MKSRAEKAGDNLINEENRLEQKNKRRQEQREAREKELLKE